MACSCQKASTAQYVWVNTYANGDQHESKTVHEAQALQEVYGGTYERREKVRT